MLCINAHTNKYKLALATLACLSFNSRVILSVFPVSHPVLVNHMNINILQSEYVQ